jgi:hypothetical protein
MSDLISKKIDELIELSKTEGDANVQIVLVALRGSIIINLDGFLAKTVQEYLTNTLIPMAKKRQDETPSLN